MVLATTPDTEDQYHTMIPTQAEASQDQTQVQEILASMMEDLRLNTNPPVVKTEVKPQPRPLDLMPIEHMKGLAEIEEQSLNAMRYQIEEAERRDSPAEAVKQALEGLRAIYMKG